MLISYRDNLRSDEIIPDRSPGNVFVSEVPVDLYKKLVY